MKLYNVLIKKNKEDKVSDVILLKEGLSLSAFLFSGLWFLYHKMFREFFTFILVLIALSQISKLYPNFDKLIIEIAVSFIIAINANYWRFKHLQEKEYQFVGVVFGADLDNAKIRFIRDFNEDFDLEEKRFNLKNLAKIKKKFKKFFAT